MPNNIPTLFCVKTEEVKQELAAVSEDFYQRFVDQFRYGELGVMVFNAAKTIDPEGNIYANFEAIVVGRYFVGEDLFIVLSTGDIVNMSEFIRPE